MNRNERDLSAPIIVLCCTVIALTAAWAFSSYKESEVFNRLTGANTTMYDAMWVQLRVVEFSITNPPERR
jgi:hypothetical protein